MNSKKKNEFILSKCWTICVPISQSLRGISITEDFIDDHILDQLGKSNIYLKASNDGQKSEVSYELVGSKLILLTNDSTNKQYSSKILSVEKGYNKDFQPYNIFILNKPIHRKYKMIMQQLKFHRLQLDRNIYNYKEAVAFIKELPNYNLFTLDKFANQLQTINEDCYKAVESLKEILQKLIKEFWATIMRKQNLDIQRDGRFQKLLSLSIEMFAMHQLHDKIYFFLSERFKKEDAYLRNKIDKLINLKITPDQLGVHKLISIDLPSAIVELATLDSCQGPYEKIICLKNTLDFIVAEVKGALVTKKSCNENSTNDISLRLEAPDTDNLIPLLLYVIIKCRMQKLYTDLYYMENFIFSISPHDYLSFSVVTFKAAIMQLREIHIKDLPKKKKKTKDGKKFTYERFN